LGLNSLEQDAQLVQQCLQGDGAAWEELVRRHTRRIFNLCYRFTANGTEAEDLSQEVFLRVYRTLASYRSAHGGFATWLTSVTRNLLIDHYRRTKRDRITDSLDDAMPVVENKESSGRRPDEQALLGELSAQVQTALTKLSPELREAVILRDLQQLDYAEIQMSLAVPEGTVKSRINRGRIELARILQQMGVGPS
jgi:RNA polymerase sigma-70 factor (ECF subfamily)